MKVLVTGADGFIGSHLAEALVRQGHTVRAMALYSSLGLRGWLDHADPALLASMEIVAGDVRDSDFMLRAAQGCDAILHLAALIAIPYSYQAAESYIDTNMKGTLNVLKAAIAADGAHVIQTSTSEVYGTAQYVPIDEHHPLNAQSPYAATKIASDQLALSFHRSFQLPVSVIRPFNTYGPRQSTRAVLPTIITQVAAGRNEISLGSLSPTRDFTHVHDTAQGFIAALETKGAVGRVVNLGSAFEVSIGEAAAMIAELMGRDVKIVEDTHRLRPAASEVERLFAATELARELLHWSPCYGGRDGFREGLRNAIDWFTQPANIARYRIGEYTV